ncbi:MAG: hypothetical protein BEU04_02190 [Marine Group III euryarchaeote CG-Bathy1]|uniref:Cell division protein SepF n=1 Tax=Marine Group III euryarchaeote CG-Bathy1 TaxID=1889001 RepID=A0A1J5TN91_9ARCH|nr:MAG: hypothetical protein BEU04_02190 [Marine Group III euryarchaeote CG-Bathy1]
MSPEQPSMRRVSDENFLDLRRWASDRSEDYGGKPKMQVQTIILKNPEQVGKISNQLYEGNIVLVDFTPMASDQQTLNKVIADLERAVADIDGDLVGISNKWIVVSPTNIRIARQKL